MFVYRSYELADFEQVKTMLDAGLGGRSVAAALGIPRSTIQNWGRRTTPPAHLLRIKEFDPDPPAIYAYLLGIYLGDGHIWRSSRRSFRLCISCDAKYPSIIEEVRSAISSFAVRVCVNATPQTGVVVVSASSAAWPMAFPQHGPGRKHERPIVLEPWQLAVTHEHPRALIRGLIHSDGCRSVNRFRTRLPSGRIAEYEYPRYFFSNLSADIRRIFCDHCDLLGIHWTRQNARNISVSRRAGVAALDAFVGPKR